MGLLHYEIIKIPVKSFAVYYLEALGEKIYEKNIEKNQFYLNMKELLKNMIILFTDMVLKNCGLY